MTNEIIILNERVKLMEEGKLKGTGEFITVEINGEKKELELPEEIHTFNGWKERGYSVKKGEHSTIKFVIWKFTKKNKKQEETAEENADGENKRNMFLKMSAFFTAEQVEPINTKGAV